MSVSGFISRAACRGRRPSHLASYTVKSRPTLIAQLMKSCNVARFIVAPSGYGKSYLALEYAETMKFWGHTFWVNAQSPCFVRDLDAGIIASCIFEFDEKAELVVFDSLPQLDVGRQERFSLEIDMLLAEGCEVLVTCSPTCDTMGASQTDRLRVCAADLLLSDDELDSIRSADERARVPSAHLGAAWRVPILAWQSKANSGEVFASAAFAEELPADVLLVMGSAFVLQRGELSEVLSFGTFDQGVLLELEGDYPHLGLDAESGVFETPSVNMSELARALRSRLPQLTSRSSYETPTQLVHAWAKALLQGGQAARACEAIQEVYPRAHQADWIVENAAELIRQVCLLPAFKLAASQKRAGSGQLHAQLDAFEALCRRLLGDEAGAIQYAKKSAFNERVSEDARTVGLLLVSRLNGGVLTRQADDALARRHGERSPLDIANSSPWALLEEMWCTRADGAAAMARLWVQMRDAGASEDALAICASWLFSMFGERRVKPQREEMHACRAVERFVRERLSTCAREGVRDYYLVSAGLSMEEAHAYGWVFEEGPLDTASLLMMRQVEMDVISQRRSFEENAKVESAKKSDWAATHPSSMTMVAASDPIGFAERSIPLLTLKMFGKFEASLGGVPLEYKRFRRQNARVLLVMLAVNQGRELSRDFVATAMWPDGSLSAARKNFYSVWSYLRRALSLPDGTCPYLVRHQYGCSLDRRFVQSDVVRFDEICRELLFGSPNIEHWSLLFSEIDRDFSSELMPAESQNELIVQARNDYRTRLVDALVTATQSILDAGIPQWGVWFARSAVKHDDTREDAYVALMRAQIAGGQRTAAMMTYHTCRRVLAEKLGIDPSPEATALYESLLDSE